MNDGAELLAVAVRWLTITARYSAVSAIARARAFKRLGPGSVELKYVHLSIDRSLYRVAESTCHLAVRDLAIIHASNQAGMFTMPRSHALQLNRQWWYLDGWSWGVEFLISPAGSCRAAGKRSTRTADPIYAPSCRINSSISSRAACARACVPRRPTVRCFLRAAY